MRRGRLLALLALVVAGLPLIPGFPLAPARAEHAGRFTCRASVIRVEDLVVLGTVEPFVANQQGDPCRPDQAGLVDADLPGGLGHATVVSAETEHEEHGFARSEARVVGLLLTVPGLPAIGVELLTAEATAGPCPAGQELSGESTVVGVTIGGQTTEIPAGHFELTLPGGLATLHLNEQIVEPNRLTQRAFFLEVPEGSPVRTVVGNIIIAEAIVDFHGNPCEPQPQERLPGWMTGGGMVAEPESKQDKNDEGTVEPGTVLHHAFSLDCFIEEGSHPGPGKNNLVLQWRDEAGNEHSSFKLEQLTDTRCFDDPALEPSPPRSVFDTIEGSGIGLCKSQGLEVPVSVEFRFTDAGEPGTDDRAEVNTDLIPGVDTPDELELICDYESEGFLDGGNHQAHQTPAQRAGSTTNAQRAGGRG